MTSNQPPEPSPSTARFDARRRPSRLGNWALRSINWYQRAAEGRPSPCRFFPSCSEYAHEAFETHRPSRAMWLTTRRLSRCRPFGPSGFDPVPLPNTASADSAVRQEN